MLPNKKQRLKDLAKRVEQLEQDLDKAKRGNPNHDNKGRFSSGSGSLTGGKESPTKNPKQEFPKGDPLNEPAVYDAFHKEAEKYVSKFKGKWDRYFEQMTDQDAWGDIVEALPKAIGDKIQAHMDRVGEFPSRGILQVLSNIERKVFGKTVEDEL